MTAGEIMDDMSVSFAAFILMPLGLSIGVIAMILSGCATDSAFKKNVQQLIDCEYDQAHRDGLTIHQIHDLQYGCYELYKLRSK